MTDALKLPTPTGSVVCTFGELVLDLVAVLAGPLPLGGQVRGTIETRPGGCARNVAVAVAEHKLPARFIGRCGDGPSSSVLTKSLDEAGVEVRAKHVGRYTTSLGLQMANGEATYVTDDSDALLMTAADVEPDWFDNCAILHTTGYDLYNPERTAVALRVFEMAHEVGAMVTFDVALGNELDNFGIQKFRRVIEEEMRPTVLFCNESEGDLLDLDHRYPAGAGVVVQHRSVAPTEVFLPSGEHFSVPVADTTTYADTVGAGDAFTGGFLSGWLKGESVYAAVVTGHQSARHYLRGLMHPAGKR